jgi:hypothetical protein
MKEEEETKRPSQSQYVVARDAGDAVVAVAIVAVVQ